ncbi:MAG: hypothetical protein KDA75_19990, partial [Planctomycetaceae bacterium]|nr:hypothetical protein [Planctomycetaceae bacterium]
RMDPTAGSPLCESGDPSFLAQLATTLQLSHSGWERMEAPTPFKPALAGLLAILSLLAGSGFSAEFRTRNFVVSAPTADVARQIAETAETCRRELAIEWLGKTIPDWYRPCPVSVKVGQMGAGGATTFTFDRGEVSGWNMRVQGTLERVLDSVIPHEVSHTIFASHFRRPLPRWADEGAATLIEHTSERKRQEVLLERVINTPKRIPLQQLLSMSEYPSEMEKVYTLYAEGYSLANFLVQQRGSEGKAVFLQFIQDAHKHGWQSAIARHYRYDGIAALEKEWSGWVLAGSPARRRPEGEAIAANTADSDRRQGPAIDGIASPEHALALAPLAPIGRAMRSDAATSLLNAPNPGSGRGTEPQAYVRGQSPLANAESKTGELVTPRVSPFPGRDASAARRMRQVQGETLANTRRAQQISTARTNDPNTDPVLRAQSPDSRHWSEFSGFPQRTAQSDVTDRSGRRIPFGG